MGVSSGAAFGVFGTPPPGLVTVPPGAAQFSPLSPGTLALEDVPPASLSGMAVVAPPGTIERRRVLALSLLALKPGAPLTVLAPKSKGGGRIAEELGSFGCEVTRASRRHYRICETTRPADIGAEALARLNAAIAAGAPCFVGGLGLWSQPGLFSWDSVDPGTALLLSVLPPLAGRGADLGCGIGVIARVVLASPNILNIDLVDIDRRAIAAARRNVADARARFHWADARTLDKLTDLDFVVMNPPFHDGGHEDRAVAEAFLRQAHRVLKAGGAAWLVANLHLPYESVLSSLFAKLALRASQGGYKVYEAIK